MANTVIRAAGGVVWRRRDTAIEVLLVHRPKYDDWSLPKGKLDPGESARDAARREVEEETGLRCSLGDALPTVEYRDRHDRPKTVAYWAMEVIEGKFVASDEVDATVWLPLDSAAERLSYARDRAPLEALRELVALRR